MAGGPYSIFASLSPFYPKVKRKLNDVKLSEIAVSGNAILFTRRHSLLNIEKNTDVFTWRVFCGGISKASQHV
jgi:hypothetical protein